MNLLLNLAGQTLYGARWQRALAKDIGVSDRHMRRYFTGEYDPAPDHWRQIIGLLERHRTEVGELIKDLRGQAKRH